MEICSSSPHGFDSGLKQNAIRGRELRDDVRVRRGRRPAVLGSPLLLDLSTLSGDDDDRQP